MTDTSVRSISDLIATGEVAPPLPKLSKEDKEKLAKDGTILTVHAVLYGTDPKNGPYWSVEATVNGEPVSFNIGSHTRRDTFMQSLANVLAGGPVTGLRLVAYPGQAGNKAVSLEPAQ